MTVFSRVVAPAATLPPQDPGTPWPTRAWSECDPDSTVDSERLTALADSAFPDPEESPYGMSLALVVVHRGRLVLERYGPSAGADEPLISWSMGKSIAHALVGVLVREGRLAVDAPLAVPEWAEVDDQRGLISLDHLLRMVGGTDFLEDYVDARTSHCIEMLFGSGAADMGAYAAGQPVVEPPGTVFNYSSGTTNIISRAMADLVGTGPDFERWMRQVLLDRLGMLSARLTFDGAGTWVGSSYVHATARDFAKFGLLYLRDGVWEGERLLPDGWVDYARTARACDDDGRWYGAHWWIWDHSRDVFACQGYETQRILVDPASDLVVVRLGKTATEDGPAVDAWLAEILSCFR